MYGNQNQRQQRVGSDRFGNPQIVVGLKIPQNSKSNFPRGFAEIGGQLYKITYSPSKKDGVEHWVSITKVPKRNNSQGRF